MVEAIDPSYDVTDVYPNRPVLVPTTPACEQCCSRTWRGYLTSVSVLDKCAVYAVPLFYTSLRSLASDKINVLL